jgi:hypothetical protein
MNSIDRRGFLRGVIGTAAVAAVATTAGVTLMTSTAEAAPVPADKNLRQAMEEFAEPVQYRRRYYRGRYWRHPSWYRRRRRRWTCWWSRGRRVCGWRYW